jgi:hypothetical protein
MNRVWEVSHDFAARLLGAILRIPLLTFWGRFGRMFYPLSAGAWLLTAGSLIFAEPKLDLSLGLITFAPLEMFAPFKRNRLTNCTLAEAVAEGQIE